MEGADIDESVIALETTIENLDSENGYESDEGSNIKPGTRQILYPKDDELSICESVTSKERSSSFRQVLSDERSFQRFSAFVKGRGCTNNLKFWVLCERFSKLGASRGAANPHARDVAKAIFHGFLKNSAPNKVCLKESTVNEIRRSLDLRMTVNPQLFAAAQKEVYDIMVENEYQQFLMSGEFSDRTSQFTGSILSAESYYSDSGSSLMGYGSVPPAPNTSRGASAVHSDIESTSMASYSDSEPSTLFHPARMLTQQRRGLRSHQPACSDTDVSIRPTRKPKRGPEKACISEQFLRKVYDRLQAVKQDRENMLLAVREQASRKGQKLEEVEKLQWFDFPGIQKKYIFSRGNTGNNTPNPQQLMAGNMSNHHSPREDSVVLRSPSEKHLDSIAHVEINRAMQHMELSSRQARLQQPTDLRGITKSPALNFTSDSGVSDTGRSMNLYSSQLPDDDILLEHSSNSEGSGATLLPMLNSDSGLSDPNPHVARYIQQQNECSDRDKEAFTAASVLLDSNPHLGQPIVRSKAYMGHLDQFMRNTNQLSMSDVDSFTEDSEFYHSDSVSNWVKQQQGQQKQQRQPKYISRPQLSEESSSNFTVRSSTLFMPRGGPYHAVSDSDDPRYYMSHKMAHRPKTNTDRRRPNNTGNRSAGQQVTPIQSSAPGIAKDPFAPKPGEASIAMFYQVEGEGTPKRRVVADKDYTLMEFKRLFGKKGDYRYFFRQWCEEIQSEIKDELIYDHDIIPKYQNKVFAFIEKSS